MDWRRLRRIWGTYLNTSLVLEIIIQRHVFIFWLWPHNIYSPLDIYAGWRKILMTIKMVNGIA